MNILKILTLLPVIGLTACSSTAYQQAETEPLINREKNESSLQFKFALRHLMPDKEVSYLESIVSDSNYRPERWSNNKADEGFVTTGLMAGGLSNSTAGGLGLIAKYALKAYENHPMLPNTSLLVIKEEHLPENVSTSAEALTYFRNKTIEHINSTAYEFGYDTKCIDNCYTARPVFELTLKDIIIKGQIYTYTPSVIVVSTNLSILREADIDNPFFLVYGKNIRFLSDYGGWSINFYSISELTNNKPTYTELDLPIGGTVKFPKNARRLISTKLGRDLYRSFSAKMNYWYSGTTYKGGYAVNNGILYKLDKLSSYSKFKGSPTTN
jgi:hypothetical protein